MDPIREIEKNLRFLILLLDDIWRLSSATDEGDKKKAARLKMDYRELIKSLREFTVGKVELPVLLELLERHKKANHYGLPLSGLNTIFKKLEIDFTTMMDHPAEGSGKPENARKPQQKSDAAKQTEGNIPKAKNKTDEPPQKPSQADADSDLPPGMEDDDAVITNITSNKPIPAVSASEIRDSFSRVQVSEEMKEAGHHFTQQDLLEIVKQNSHLRTGAMMRKEGRRVLKTLIKTIRQQDPEKISGMINNYRKPH